jgi:putative endonuclease
LPTGARRIANPPQDSILPHRCYYGASMLNLLYRAADALRRRFGPTDHGRLGEDLAHRYLRRRGCTIVARNYTTRSGSGEIDLIVRQGPTLAFVEVKTRTSQEHGEPESAVDAEKHARIQHAARDYARRAGADWQHIRFDVVSIVLDRPPRIEWLRDAFGANG